jgi:hypothetical protein
MAATQSQVRRIVFGAGALLAVFAAARWWHGERVFARMQPITCTLVVKVVESELLVDQGPRGRRALTGNAKLRYRDEARLVFRYTVDARNYTFREDFNADERPLAQYVEGKTYPCRFDPEHPGRATITTAFDREEVVTVLVLAGFLFFLGAMMPQIWRQAVEGLARMRGR